MAEAVARRAGSGALVTGVDVWADNEDTFIRRIAATGRRARFVRTQIGAQLPWPAASFDVVICSYSLYFFREILPEVSRVLAPEGLFLALTHSEECFLSLAEVADSRAARSELHSLAGRFSAENGAGLLQPWFAHVERVDYQNALRFRAEQADDLLALLRFKLPFLEPGAKPGGELPESISRRVREAFERSSELLIPKNDAAFRCREPLHR
jgi:ubiquinone/menaquinone biosynthesis C-methylase UbiE